MATLDEIKNQLNIALKEHKKAEDKSKEFEDGENGGKWLEELRGKARRKELDQEDKEEKKRLEKKEEELTKKVEDRLKQVDELQKALVNSLS